MDLKKWKLKADYINFSKDIAEKGLSYSYLLKVGTNVTFIIKDPVLLRGVLNLYYGFRCVFAHGCPDRTLKDGALKRSPTDNLKKMIQGHVHYTPRGKEPSENNKRDDYAVKLCAELGSIHEKLCEDKGDADIDYLTLVNMYRFFHILSCFLTHIVAFRLENDFPVKLSWDPRLQQTEI